MTKYLPLGKMAGVRGPEASKLVASAYSVHNMRGPASKSLSI